MREMQEREQTRRYDAAVMPRAWNRETLIALRATHTARKVAEQIAYSPLEVPAPPEPRRLPFVKAIGRIVFVRASGVEVFSTYQFLIFIGLLIAFLVLPALMMIF
jgi:hypothetical protein